MGLTSLHSSRTPLGSPGQVELSGLHGLRTTSVPLSIKAPKELRVPLALSTSQDFQQYSEALKLSCPKGQIGH